MCPDKEVTMRRSYVLLLAISAVAFLSPAVFGQYPYPYSPIPLQYASPYPMPVQYAQPYGYRMPTYYAPYPMTTRPVYYSPAPRPQRTVVVQDLPVGAPKVYDIAPPAEEKTLPIFPPSPTPAPESIKQSRTIKSQPEPTLAPVEMGPDLSPANAPGRGGIFAAVGFYLLQPHFQSNPAFQVNSAPPGGPVSGSQREFTYGNSVSPQATIGYETASGLGIRVSGWRFDQKAREAATVGPNGFITAANPLGLGAGLATGPGDRIVANSRLRLDVIDVEITERFEPSRCWSFLLGGGVRYANIVQEYAFNATTPGFGATGAVSSSRNYSSIGPAVSFEAHRNIANCGLGLYATGHGSVLFGSAHQRADLSTLGVGGVFGPAASNESSQSHVMPTTEFEVGAEYRHAIGRTQVLVQAGFVGQVWFGAGNATNTDSTFTGNSNNNLNLGFVGLAVRAGLKY
jgi:hypothetical protein